MHVNHRYLLATGRNAAAGARAAILDFGCGAGELVEQGRRQGLNVFGADVFYEGGSTRHTVIDKGLYGREVFEICDGVIPFPSATFDVVVANQVFEHVEDLEQVSREICRVLRPEGKLISLFPSRESLREGHCGIPLVHRFSRSSRLRFPYMLACRTLGLGYHKRSVSRSQWCSDFLDWLDRYTHYRSRHELERVLGAEFQSVQFCEEDYMRFRLQASKLAFLVPLLRFSVVRRLVGWISIRFGSTVVFARKSPAPCALAERDVAA